MSSHDADVDATIARVLSSNSVVAAQETIEAVQRKCDSCVVILFISKSI
mgnify:CR=1 FL=1